MDFLENINGIIKSIFLMLLAISGGYVAQTLGCKTQKLLTENMSVKHLVIIMLIFFTNSVFGDNIDPSENFKTTFVIYFCYLLFTKIGHTYLTILVFSLLGINYILSTYVAYYEKNEIEGERVKKIKDIQKKLTIVSMVTVLLGFSLYLKKKYVEYGKDFSVITFIFGVLKCKSLK